MSLLFNHYYYLKVHDNFEPMNFHKLAMKFSSLSCAKHTFKTYILNHILRAVLFNVRIEITRARKVKFERTSERSLRFATLPSLFIPPSLMVLAFQSLINKETSIQQWYIDILRFVSYVVTHRPAYHQYDKLFIFPSSWKCAETLMTHLHNL